MGQGQHRGIIRPFEAELELSGRLADAGCIGLALWLTTVMYDEPWTQGATIACLAGMLLFYLCAQLTGLYQAHRGTPLAREARSVWVAWGTAFLLLVLAGFVTKTSADHSRKLMLTWALLAPTTVTLFRAGLTFAAQELRVRGHNTRSVAIVGVSDLGQRLAQRIEAAPWMGLRLVGFYDDRGIERLEPRGSFEYSLLGGFQALVQAARKGEVDLVYITLPPRAEPRIVELMGRLQDTTASVHLAYDFGGFDLLRAHWSAVGDIPVMAVVENPFYGSDGVLKRIEDIVLGTVFTLLAGIPMLLIALGVKLTSKGPVFFQQRRYGLNGEEIKVLKFRTMTVSEDGDEVTQAQKGDPRVTAFGSFLRRTSLDELPQLLQVVTGTMSLVGPRPHAVAHNEQYRSLIRGYMLRHKVKPGITGWAQVNGWRGETDTLEKMQQRVHFDLEYIRRWRLSFDLVILAMTVRQVMFGHRNAY